MGEGWQSCIFVLEMFVGLQVGPSHFQKGLLVQEFELGEFTRLAIALITFVLVNCWGLGRKSWNWDCGNAVGSKGDGFLLSCWIGTKLSSSLWYPVNPSLLFVLDKISDFAPSPEFGLPSFAFDWLHRAPARPGTSRQRTEGYQVQELTPVSPSQLWSCTHVLLSSQTWAIPRNHYRGPMRTRPSLK